CGAQRRIRSHTVTRALIPFDRSFHAIA
ncbi:MAG: hypothetical protein RJA29_2116, partial [Pseudomonadota bacterium]